VTIIDEEDDEMVTVAIPMTGNAIDVLKMSCEMSRVTLRHVI
jgi:hypothetical protein